MQRTGILMTNPMFVTQVVLQVTFVDTKLGRASLDRDQSNRAKSNNIAYAFPGNSFKVSVKPD